MGKNPLNQGVVTENFIGIGAVSREMIEARARELALIAGHAPPYVSQADYEQARRELSGKSGLDPRVATQESLAESARWDPVPGSVGHQSPESPEEEADEEGRNESAQLVAEGVKEAGHDRMLQAARAAEDSDQSEQGVSSPPRPPA